MCVCVCEFIKTQPNNKKLSDVSNVKVESRTAGLRRASLGIEGTLSHYAVLGRCGPRDGSHPKG